MQAIPEHEFVVALATMCDDERGFNNNLPALDAHIVANEEQVVVDLARPGAPWKNGPRVYIERVEKGWKVFVHSNDDDVKALVLIADDETVVVKTFDENVSVDALG